MVGVHSKMRKPIMGHQYTPFGLFMVVSGIKGLHTIIPQNITNPSYGKQSGHPLNLALKTTCFSLAITISQKVH